MPTDNERPLAVVVGAGGLGMAVSRRLGLDHRLLIADRDNDHLQRQRAALLAEGHDAKVMACDVTLEADVAALIDSAKANGPVRALANVVGLSPGMGDFRTIMAVNLIGASRIAKGMINTMPPGAAAVFIASSAAHMGSVPASVTGLLEAPLADDFLDAIETATSETASPALAYMLSKAGLIGMCRRAAPEWGARGVRITSLSPGLIATPQGAAEHRRSPTKRDLLAAIPLQREGTMLEIAETVAFLLSPRASFISGIDLLVDGGMMAALR